MLIKSVMNVLIYSLFIYFSIVNLLKLTFCWIKITAIINIKWSYLKWTNSIFKKKYLTALGTKCFCEKRVHIPRGIVLQILF